MIASEWHLTRGSRVYNPTLGKPCHLFGGPQENQMPKGSNACCIPMVRVA